MDEQDLQQFQQYVKEFSNVAGDKRTSQGLANLVMIQKELGGQKLSPVQLEDDAIYSTKKSGSLGLVRNMKVSLDGATEETFTPLIEGLRRSTLNVRLRNSIGDIVEPLANSLYANQLEGMMHQNELHREDVIYYRQMIHAIDNLGKENRQSFLDSVLVGFRRFTRNPIWTSLSYAVMGLRKAVIGPLWSILTGWKKKSDTEKIIDAIHQQTKFMRTGEIDNMSFMEKFMEKGIIGVMGKSFTDSIKIATGKDKATTNSPQQQTNNILSGLSDSLVKNMQAMNSGLITIVKGDDKRNDLLSHIAHDSDSYVSAVSEMVDAQKQGTETIVTESKKTADGTVVSFADHVNSSSKATSSKLEKVVDFQKMTLDSTNNAYKNNSSLLLELMETQQDIFKEQKQSTEELEEHNRREKRRTLFSILKTALPGVLGVLGIGILGGATWLAMPDKAKEVIADGVKSAFNKFFTWEDIGTLIGVGLMFSPLGWKIKGIGFALAGISMLVKSFRDSDREHAGPLGFSGGVEGVRDSIRSAVESAEISALVMRDSDFISSNPNIIALQQSIADMKERRLGVPPHERQKIMMLDNNIESMEKTMRELKDQLLSTMDKSVITKQGLRGALEVAGGMQRRSTSGSLPRGLLDFIGKHESKGNYDALVYGNNTPSSADLSNMTIAEVLDYQAGMKERGHASSAVGKYQFLRGTLQETIAKNPNIGLDTQFNKETQDRLAMDLLRRRGYDDFVSGKMDNPENFLQGLSKEWASLPTKDGSSYYAGDSVGNKASVGYDEFRNVVFSTRNMNNRRSQPEQTPTEKHLSVVDRGINLRKDMGMDYGDLAAQRRNILASAVPSGPSISESAVRGAIETSKVIPNTNDDEGVKAYLGKMITQLGQIAGILDREDPLDSPSDKGTTYAAFGE